MSSTRSHGWARIAPVTRIESTVSQSDGHKANGAASSAYLIEVLQCERPLEPPRRLALDDVDSLTLGRGEALGIEPMGDDVRGGERFFWAVRDRWASSRHAELVRVGRAWVLVDAGSKNGTIKGGTRIERAPLKDGDVFEIGHSFFLFRIGRAGGEAQSREARAAAPLDGMATLALDFEADLRRLAEVARAPVPVMLRGETGTGKERLANAIHSLSGRPGGLVPVNCGAMPASLVGSELFGYRKGAFSGAVEDRAGLVRAAHRGTLFLDEVGDLGHDAQVALLRALQESEVRALGDTRTHQVDLRLVSATHQELEQLVEEGRFRSDFYARLSGFTLELPPLRQRREDMGLLVAALLRRLTPRAGDLRFERDAARALMSYAWPRNVRELERCLAAAVPLALARDGTIGLDDLPRVVREAPGEAMTPSIVVPERLSEEDQQRRQQLLELLENNGGNVAAVARALGKARMQIHRWIKRYGIDLKKHRP